MSWGRAADGAPRPTSIHEKFKYPARATSTRATPSGRVKAVAILIAICRSGRRNCLASSKQKREREVTQLRPGRILDHELRPRVGVAQPLFEFQVHGELTV
ncbi:MAG TPA: hypothetical protein VNE83_07430 [Terriglobales bacterium]|nr:hypothetical protein [Terriglobales bacterium]